MSPKASATRAALAFFLCACTAGQRGNQPPESMPEEPAPDLSLPPPPPDPCRGVPTTGRCADPQTIEVCRSDQRGNLSLATVSCAADERCRADGPRVSCELAAPCRNGLTRCQGATVASCTGGRWQQTACGAGTVCRNFPGLGAGCASAGVGPTVKGQLSYQFRMPRADFRGYDAPVVDAARSLLALVVDGSEVLGSGFTGSGMADGGMFAIQTFRTPGPGSQLLFFPLLLADDGSPMLGIAQPQTTSQPTRAPNLWAYHLALPSVVAGAIDVGPVTATAEASGGIYIYEWALFELFRMERLFGRFPSQSLVFMWNPGLDWNSGPASCGACYLNAAFGGTTVGTGASPLRFDTSILLSGSPANPSHWSASVINHEYGHFTMDEYSLSPGEGGAHVVDQVSSPGLAWSEGWATFSGQSGMSSPTLNPIYFDVQGNVAFWIDISRGNFIGGPLPLPNPMGSLAQGVNENIVAGLLWDLFRRRGEAPIYQAMASDRVRLGAAVGRPGRYNRGYRTVDWVDGMDALVCGRSVPLADLGNALGAFRFPWQDPALCPATSAPFMLELQSAEPDRAGQVVLTARIQSQLAQPAPLTLELLRTSSGTTKKLLARETVRLAPGEVLMRQFAVPGPVTAEAPVLLVADLDRTPVFRAHAERQVPAPPLAPAPAPQSSSSVQWLGRLPVGAPASLQRASSR